MSTPTTLPAEIFRLAKEIRETILYVTVRDDHGRGKVCEMRPACYEIELEEFEHATFNDCLSSLGRRFQHGTDREERLLELLREFDAAMPQVSSQSPQYRAARWHFDRLIEENVFEVHRHSDVMERISRSAEHSLMALVVWRRIDPDLLEKFVAAARDYLAGAELNAARHSEDFISVHRYGHDFVFSKTQAACVEKLWEAWENGTPALSEVTILDAAGSTSDRLRDIFRQGKVVHPAWDTMIVAPCKGTYSLQPPA